MAPDNYQETFQTWNKIASLYEEKFMDLDIYNKSYELFCNALLSDHATVLEIACGPGNITRQLLKRLPQLSITGIDVSPNMIELAAKNNPSAKFLTMDCRELPQLQTKFEAIICGFCLPYLSDEDCIKFIAECSQLLSPKGLFYLSFVEGEKENSGMKSGSSGDRSFFNYHKLEDIQKLLSDNGFGEATILKVDYTSASKQMEEHTILISSLL